MNQMPSFPGSGSIWFKEAPVPAHAEMAGRLQMVLPTGEKCEVRCPAHHELAIGDVVIHVAFAGMRLAPGVFMRSDILGFGEVGRALIKVLV